MTVGGWAAGRGGGGGAAGRGGETVTLGGANGPAGWRLGGGAGAPRSSGRNGTILGSGLLGPAGAGGTGGGASGAAGLGTTGSGGAATTVGSGTISGSGSGTNGGCGAMSGTAPAGFGFTIVAAGLTSAATSSSVLAFFDREAGFFATRSPAAASPASSVLGFGYALGLRRFRQVTALAELHAQRVRERAVEGTHGPDALVAHLLGRDHQIFAGHAELLGELDHLYLGCCHCPLTSLRSHRDHCDIADRSRAGLTQERALRARFGQRSLWLTPRGGSHRRDQIRTCLTGLSECVTEPTAAQAALETFGLGTHIRAAACRARPAVHDHRSARRSGQPHEVGLRPSSPTSKTRAARGCLHDGVGSP